MPARASQLTATAPAALPVLVVVPLVDEPDPPDEAPVTEERALESAEEIDEPAEDAALEAEDAREDAVEAAPPVALEAAEVALLAPDDARHRVSVTLLYQQGRGDIPLIAAHSAV